MKLSTFKTAFLLTAILASGLAQAARPMSMLYLGADKEQGQEGKAYENYILKCSDGRRFDLVENTENRWCVNSPDKYCSAKKMRAASKACRS